MGFLSKKSLFITISLFVFFANVFAVYVFLYKKNNNLQNLVIKKIYLSSTRYTDKKLLEKLVKKLQYEYMGSDKIEVLQREISQLPFIKKVRIIKRYPDEILVKIVEKDVKYITGSGYFLDNDLSVINVKIDDYSQYSDMVVLNGNINKNMVFDLFNELNKLTFLKQNIVSATLISDRRWNIVINIYGKNVLFKLPEANIAYTLSSFFKKVYKTNIFNKISIVDLRSDKIIISI